MKLAELVAEYAAAREVGLMLTSPELEDCAVRAARFYAGYGDIASISKVDVQPAAGQLPEDPPPDMTEAYPVKDLGLISVDTEVSVGEWVVIAPLFYLYVELMNATRMEASRSSGIEAFGRTVGEVQGDINAMENETLPAKCFSSFVVSV